MTSINERKFSSYIYIQKAKKMRNILYTKSQTLCKKQENFRYFFVCKKEDTLCYAIFNENFDIRIYIQKV